MRRSAETSAAGVRTDDISATRRLHIRVLQALLDALTQPLAVQALISDFEAALWSAVRDVFPGDAQRGCEFHFSQAVWRNVQSVGLQSAYAKHRRYSFLSADVIGDEFGKLEQVAAAGGDTRVQELSLIHI